MKNTTLRLCCLVVSFLVYGSLLFECEVGAFNLDPFSVTVIRSPSAADQPSSQPAQDYFGFSQALLREDNETWLMVGAPRANVSWDPSILEPGTVYKCRLADKATKADQCTRLRMDFEPEDQPKYTSHKYSQWLGASMDVSSADGGQFVVCAHKYKYEHEWHKFHWLVGKCYLKTKNQQLSLQPYQDYDKVYSVDKFIWGVGQAGTSVHLSQACGHRQTFNETFPGKHYMHGICFSRNGTKEGNASKISTAGTPLTIASWNPVTRDNSRNVYRMAFAQWGLSMRTSTDGHVVMGGPGLWQWQGGLFVYFGPEQNCSIENATLTDSYLGYSVTAIRWPPTYPKRNPSRYLFAGGAPRYKEAGAVYIFDAVMPIRLHTNITCDFRTVQEITSQSYGSYFGASILAEDTNADGVDELFVGAPFENLTLGDEGAVHYYVRNTTTGGVFVKAKVLTGTKQGDARFGTAIASIGDLNFDGFKDVIIGSPMEDEGRGAIYIYNGSPSGIETHYSQRIAAANIPVLRSATLGSNEKIVLVDGQSLEHHPVHFLDVPCLAEPGRAQCVSFLAADRHATYMHLYDRNLYLHNMYTAKNLEDYKKEASFYLSKDLAYDKVVYIRPYTMTNFYLVSDEHGNLTVRQMVRDEWPKDAAFTFTRGRYLSCMKDLSYELNIESESDSGRRGYLKLPEGARTSGPSKESVDFTVENIEQPLNRSWKIIFPRYPKNIATPMKFRLNLTGPSFTIESRSSLVNASIDRVIFDELLPVLSRRSNKTFTGEIGFKKECGDDDVCQASLTVNMTLQKWGAHIRGLVVGSTKHLDLRFYIENSGEAAYSVRLEIVHPSVLPYSKLEPENACNQVTGTTFDMSVNGSAAIANNGSVVQGLNCDVENQLHTNASIAFEVQLDTINFREESDFPKDVLELHCRVGTHGHIRNGTRIQSFEVPIRYEAQLEAFGRPSEPPVLEFNEDAAESKKPSVTLKHEYRISNVDDKDGGPRGVMPSVFIEVLLPDDSVLKVSKILDVKVIVNGIRSSRAFERVVKETTDNSDGPAIATSTMNPTEQNETRTSTNAGQNSGNTAKNFQFARQTFFMHCATGPCSKIRRFNIGSMYVGDKARVIITVEFSAVSLSAMFKNLSKVNYTSSVRLRPYSLSADVKRWRDGKVEIVATNLQTSTVIRSRPEQAGIPIWLILVGVGVGILHIFAFILILKKCGFFDRKMHMQMHDEMMRENRDSKVLLDDAGAEQMEVESQYDNELLREERLVKSPSQCSTTGSDGNNGDDNKGDGNKGDEMKRSVSSIVDALHAQHPGVDFRANE